MRRITTPPRPLPLHATHSARRIEQAALAAHAPFELMARAGLAAARWTLALAPHAQRLWVAAGPGNNGGDGLVLARHWQALGRTVHVSLHADPARLPPDAQRALAEARAAGVEIHHAAPSSPVDLAIDALLGLGQREPPRGTVAQGVAALHAQGAPVLALDTPTGLCPDTGQRRGQAVRAHATLSLLTLKPGLFTADGRDACGELWWDSLGCNEWLAPEPATAHLLSTETVLSALPQRPHTSHKGRFGDCWIIGGATGMSGAAVLAARAALLAGAGRVYLCPLAPPAVTASCAPELMWRDTTSLDAETLAQATVVCGCGGGTPVSHVLPQVLRHAGRLVLDADALNAISSSPALAQALHQRGQRASRTVLTPHPLEAARLLGQSATEVQGHRLRSAQTLADQYQAIVVLKGSGTVLAAPGRTPAINPSGNGRLATAGSGDVLAGWLGGCWSALDETETTTDAAWLASTASVCLHGLAAEDAAHQARLPLPASQLADAMAIRAMG